MEYPVSVTMEPVTEERNRLTTLFRFFLALPHMIIVGGPIAAIITLSYTTERGLHYEWGSGGLLGGVVAITTFMAWFVILFTGRYPDSLWNLASFYMRWRVRAVAYMTLLRDEYPPFGDDEYPATLTIPRPERPRDRLTVAFRCILVFPHAFMLSILGVAWGLTTAIAWISILLTGRFPDLLYGFALGVFAWTVRVESYLLLLRDEYPPFTLRV